MKDAYCSFEIAKLLKEKGFDEECTHYYSYEDDELIEYTNGVYSRNSKDCHRCTSPTHQMACAWLRKQGVYMSIDTVITSSGNTYFNIYTYSKDSGWIHPVDFYNSYEDAVEAALKYALEDLI